MKKLKESELRKLLMDRPKLEEWLELYEVTEVYIMTEAPTTKEADTWSKRNALLVAKGKEHNYMIVDTAATKSSPDTLKVWLADDMPILEDEPEPSRDYVIIERAKMGRPRRELTEEQKEQILKLHNENIGINKIAKQMKLGTRRITLVIKQREQEQET